MAVRFRLLSGVEAQVGGVPVDLGHPRQRAVLGVLLVEANRLVSTDQLLDRVWGEHCPKRGRETVYNYLSRLRAALRAAGDDVLLDRRSGGYVLAVDDQAVDLHQFRRLVTQARAVRNDQQAFELFERALALWRSEPLSGLDTPWVTGLRVTLDNERLAAELDHADRALRCGRHAELLPSLSARATQYPWDERVAGQIMLALYRSGRQAEALDAYAGTRRRLADELGITPSAQLSALHQSILKADPALAAPSATGPAALRTVIPAQLPASVADFTGRAEAGRVLGEQLAEASLDGNAVVLSAVVGIGGVGKTTLAVYVAHAVRQDFPDGQLYVDLQGTDPRPADPEAVLASFLRALGIPSAAIPESLAERAALYRSTLNGRRVLALLDNAYDAAQIRQLLPGAPGCAALVTSRARMTGLAGARMVDLEVMSPEEALLLFTKIVGEQRVRSDRRAALDVVGACGFLPLAIRIAAARLAARRAWTVSVLADKLADHRGRLDELRAGDLAVEATFALGYGHVSPTQARAFRLLSLPDVPDSSLDAAAAVLDLGPGAAEELLESLVDISLIESAAPARYRFHDLLRLYARERAEDDETPEARCQALSRLLDFYLASAAHAFELEIPGDGVLAFVAPTSRPGLSFTTGEEALEWLLSEARGLISAAHQAAGNSDRDTVRQAVDLLFVIHEHLELGAFAGHYEQAVRALVCAAQKRSDTLAEARARLLCAELLYMQSRFPESDEEAQHSHTAALAAKDPLAVGHATNVRGLVAYKDRRYQDGAEFMATALKAFRTYGIRHGESAALCNLSRAQLNLGDPDTAVATCRQALAIHRELGTSLRLGNVLYALSIALTSAGHLDQALTCLAQALEIFRETRQQFWEGMALYRFGEVHMKAGRIQLAASYIEQALVILRDLGGGWRIANALTALGKALAGTNQPLRARTCWQEALNVFAALGSPEEHEVRQLLHSAH
ncbi:tetratricopeptide repeat protein [Streptomyces sp. NBC_00433]